jgi:hypothetical protein
MRERSFDPPPEEYGAELLGLTVPKYGRENWEDWLQGDWRNRKAKLPGEGYEESDVDPDAIIARVNEMEHPSAPLPWKPAQLEAFPANKFILSEKTGRVAAQVYWTGFAGQRLLADAPTLLLSLSREVKRLRSKLANCKHGPQTKGSNV